ncbi:MAG: hypothetical protein R3C49_08545 [Planctomycetaceae bacterium]
MPSRLLLLSMLIFCLPSGAASAETLDTAVGEVVDKLCRYLKSKGETQISIGQFTGPPQLQTSSGPGIAKMFHQHFERNRITIAARCNIGMKGEYSVTKTSGEGIGIRIRGSLVDAFGDVLTDFNANGRELHPSENRLSMPWKTWQPSPE